MVKVKVCCCCNRQGKDTYHKVTDIVELMKYLEVPNNSGLICTGCRRKYYDLKNEKNLSTKVRSLPITPSASN